MLEIYLDKRGEAAIENISEMLDAFPDDAERAAASALKSEGFRLKKLIKAAIRAGGTKTETWEKLNPHTGVISRAKKGFIKNYKMVWKGQKGSKKRVRQYKRVMLSKRANPLTKLGSAVRYKYDRDMHLVSIGFIQSEGVSQSMLKLAGMHAKGFETPVTRRMRKMMFALGFPLKKTTTVLKTPARPVIQWIFEQEAEDIPKNLEIKFFKAMERYRS